MPIFKGAGVAIVTPMKENLEVNYELLERNINYQIDNGTDAIIIAGTTGESATLSEEEHKKVVKAAIEFTKHRVPVIAGTGSNCTKTAVYLSQEAEKLGADGVLLVSPYYNKATQNGLKNHFVTIAKSIHIPVILYNIQGRTGVNILPSTITAIAEEAENVVAVKEASGNISQVAEIAKQTKGKLDIYSGNDDQIIPILSLGGKGVISVLSNVAPKQTHQMCEEYFNGNVEKAKDMQLEALDLIHALFCEVNPIPVKTALNLMGWKVGPTRMPLCEMEPENEERLKKALADYGIKLA